MATLNLDISAKFDINLLELHSAYVEIQYWQNAAKTLPMAITGTLTLTAKNTVTGEVIPIEEGSGLSKATNRIIIDRTVAQMSFSKGVWAWDIRGDLDNGYSIPYASGKIFSN
jgi:hypothetical protein